MKRLVIWVAVWVTFGGTQAAVAQAQDGTWVQLEAQPTPQDANERARFFAQRADNISGFALGDRWFAVVMGPYPTRAAATRGLQVLRSSGPVPSDAFLTDGGRFGDRFWPALNDVPQAPAVAADPDTSSPASVPGTNDAPEESLQDARAAEQALTQAEKELLQTALGWAGFYDAAIDGAFGRGTRSAMEAWQLAQGFTPTGVLSTAQRAQLIGAYNAVLDGMDMQLVRDTSAGVEVMVPTGVVSFTQYDPPFARYGAKGDLDAQVLLISQVGDQNRLFGLYEILQTLKIFPEDGPRTRRDDSFEIAGQNDRVQSYVTARMQDGQIKGFALVWPAGDSLRFDRIRDQMSTSFSAVDGVLDPMIAEPSADQAVDLVAGLQIRQPKTTRAGFFIDAGGSVLTDAKAFAECTDITVNDSHAATVRLVDADLGIAVLTPQEALAPQAVVAFQTQIPRLQTEVAVAGFPYGGVLSMPTLTFGRLADLRGLNGEENVKRLDLPARDGDAGGPVFDNGGAVLGMMLPRAPQSGQVLPPEVSFLVDADRIVAALSDAGIDVDTTDTLAFMTPETLTLRAAESTVLVSCW